MSALTKSKPQIIEQDGKPTFAVIPYEEYLKLVENDKESYIEEVYIPHEVVAASVRQNISLIKAWREHLDLTQEEVSRRAGMSQSSYVRVERVGVKHRDSTLKKIATAFGIKKEQLEN